MELPSRIVRVAWHISPPGSVHMISLFTICPPNANTHIQFSRFEEGKPMGVRDKPTKSRHPHQRRQLGTIAKPCHRDPNGRFGSSLRSVRQSGRVGRCFHRFFRPRCPVHFTGAAVGRCQPFSAVPVESRASGPTTASPPRPNHLPRTATPIPTPPSHASATPSSIHYESFAQGRR